MLTSFECFRRCIWASWLSTQHWPSWVIAALGVFLIGSAGMTFDAMTPEIISVGVFYVGLVLLGFWFANPKGALFLALLATPLIIVGHWITIAPHPQEWESWLNRFLAIATVWLTAAFVWRTRVLEENLRVQIEISNRLSQEMRHRIGNHLQLVASFLRVQARSSPSEQSRHVLELAESRVMAIGNIQRMLSRSAPSQMINAKAFMTAIVGEVRSTLPDPEKVEITVCADPVPLPSTKAIALGALLLELINNSVKHAFPDDIKGTLGVSFTASNDKYIVEVKDDGIGMDQGTRGGFGRQNVADIARLMSGSITCQPASQSNARPGTIWRLVIPA